MAEAARNIPKVETKGSVDEAIARIRDTHTEELVIAICGPIGSGHHELAECLKEHLKDFKYDVEVIRLSKTIEKCAGPATRESRFDRVKQLQDKGNELRDKYRPDYLASKAIEIIALERESKKDASGKTAFESLRKCYIIDSIKHPAEHEILKLTYREIFYCFGIYAPLHVRERNLKQQGMNNAEIYQLVDRDSGEEIEHGQQVRETFVKSDFFLRLESSNHEGLKSQVDRYLTLVFGTSIVTPTLHESAMHHAWVAAANSACLSRQVGAALVDKRGQLISVGWNDVPKYGGGLYHTDPDDEQRKKDHRCMYLRGGQCFNDLQKKSVAEDLFERLTIVGLLKKEQLPEFEAVVRKTRIRGLIEFSRSIHAEMHAILSAIDSEGARVKGSKIFTTTYPCHSCARHIVAAGIEEVYYIEPYRKSLATDLHDDAITENETEKNKVKILPFHGVAPQRYFSLFMPKADERKHSDTGKMKKYNRLDARPVQEKSIEAIPTLEAIVVESLADIESTRGSGDEKP